MFHSVGRQFNVITFHILQNKLCSNIPVLLAAEAKIDFFFYFIKIRDQYGSPLTALSLSLLLSFSRSRYTGFDVEFKAAANVFFIWRTFR